MTADAGPDSVSTAIYQEKVFYSIFVWPLLFTEWNAEHIQCAICVHRTARRGFFCTRRGWGVILHLSFEDTLRTIHFLLIIYLTKNTVSTKNENKVEPAMEKQSCAEPKRKTKNVRPLDILD